jgi:hypothetical protein
MLSAGRPPNVVGPRSITSMMGLSTNQAVMSSAVASIDASLLPEGSLAA